MSINEFLSTTVTFFVVFSVILCLVVLLLTIYKQRIRMINAGVCDEEISVAYKKEYKNRKINKALNKISSVFSVALFSVFMCIFAISLYAQLSGNMFPISGMYNASVVMSGSMSKKHEKNTYLDENNLNNQFQVYDIIIIKELPDEKDLKLYDVVVYEIEETKVVHRIIGIEEPNEKHPDKRLFLLRGDASEYNDKALVSYDQMKAIYTGNAIPYFGVFILFFQSTLGYIALIVLLAYCIFVPMGEKSIRKAEYARLGFIDVLMGEDRTIYIEKLYKESVISRHISRVIYKKPIEREIIEPKSNKKITRDIKSNKYKI